MARDLSPTFTFPLVLSSLVFLGCTRSPETSFTASEALGELSELHQANIQDGLRQMFGTPSQPRFVPLSLDEDEAVAAEEAELDSAEPPPQFAADLLLADRLSRGAEAYTQRCSGCHGVGGTGQGAAAAYLRPKPRDYRQGVYKFTSTPYGARPARQDLVRTIRRGAKGTSMPAFPWMSRDDLEAVIDYVIYLSVRGRVESILVDISEDYDEDEPIDPEEFVDAIESEVARWQSAESEVVRAVSAEPPYDIDSVKQGRSLFIESSCYSCHGEDAEGQTEWLSSEFLAAQESAPPEARIQINYDAWGDPAPAADITARMLHGGRRPLDIYRRIYTGINGTPMPAFGQIFRENPDAIWHMVHYVIHIVDGGDPTVGISVSDVKPDEET